MANHQPGDRSKKEHSKNETDDINDYRFFTWINLPLNENLFRSGLTSYNGK